MVEIPENTAARQAIDTIRGYAFQIYETAHAWLQLQADERLLVEVADDYALAADQALQTVQVKDTPSQVVTLSSAGVIKTLNNLWALRKANPSLIVRATYLTTSTISREKGRWFPNQQPGLLHWSQVAHDGGDLTALRRVLAEQQLDEDFKAWIVQSDDACLRVELLQRVTFLAGSPGLHQRAAQLRASLRKRPGRNLSASDTEHVADAVAARLLRVAAGQEPRDLSPARFPFTEAGFNAAVFKAIDGAEDLAFLSPVEPDILGGWLVLSRLAPEHPFDHRPADLLAAAQTRAEAAEIDASAYGAFRLRALQDHPDETTRSGLLHAPPPTAAHHAVIAWLDLAFEGFDLIERSNAAAAMTILTEIEAIYQARSADPDIAIAATSAAAAYIVPLSRRDTVASLALLGDLVLRATTRPELTDGLRAISLPASWLGQALVEQGALAEAQSVFESLIALAEAAARQAFKEREEVYEDAARTGLWLRQHCRTHDATILAEALDLRLWGRAPAESADLAEATGMTLMEWIGEEVGDDAAFMAEFIERSDRRLDRPLISFWTANALYGQTRELEKSQDARAFVDMAKALAAWLKPRLQLVPEMPEVLWDAEDAGWITDDFQLGPVVAERLFDVWREEHLRVVSQVEGPRRSNALADLRGELDAVLDASTEALWSKAIRMALRRLDEVAGEALQARGGEPGATTFLPDVDLST